MGFITFLLLPEQTILSSIYHGCLDSVFRFDSDGLCYVLDHLISLSGLLVHIHYESWIIGLIGLGEIFSSASKSGGVFSGCECNEQNFCLLRISESNLLNIYFVPVNVFYIEVFFGPGFGQGFDYALEANVKFLCGF